MTLPPLRDLLDPRAPEAAAAQPILGAVNIPFGELGGRLHELPARHEIVRVADVGSEAKEVVAWLRDGGRCAELAGSLEHGPAAPGRLWRPNAFLEEVLPRLGTPGRAVDLGCGAGREAVLLAASGWNVTAIDRLPDALARGRDLELRTCGASSVRWVCADLEAERGSVDVPRVHEGGRGGPPPMGEAELVVSFFYLHRPSARAAAAALSPGGSVVFETFTELHRQRFGKPRTASFVLAPGELPTLAPGLEVVVFDEGWRADGRHTARLWARRPAE